MYETEDIPEDPKLKSRVKETSCQTRLTTRIRSIMQAIRPIQTVSFRECKSLVKNLQLVCKRLVCLKMTQKLSALVKYTSLFDTNVKKS